MKNFVIIWMIGVCSAGFNVIFAQENRNKNHTVQKEQDLYLGQKPPGKTPVIFAPGIVSTDVNDFTITFSPDGKEAFFTTTEQFCTIMSLSFGPEGWTEARPAPFSSHYSDADPIFSPDGKRLFFGSNRPIPGEDSIPNGYNLWMVERIPGGWDQPRSLCPLINTESWEMFMSIASDGTLYYGTDGLPESNGLEDIYRSDCLEGKFTEPRNLGDAINSVYPDLEPFIAPDESYLIYSSWGRPDGYGSGDLYISFKDTNGCWLPALNMGPVINTKGVEQAPLGSPDGKYLFFTSQREGRSSKDVYWVDADIIETLKQDK